MDYPRLASPHEKKVNLAVSESSMEINHPRWTIRSIFIVNLILTWSEVYTIFSLATNVLVCARKVIKKYDSTLREKFLITIITWYTSINLWYHIILCYHNMVITITMLVIKIIFMFSSIEKYIYIFSYFQCQLYIIIKYFSNQYYELRYLKVARAHSHTMYKYTIGNLYAIHLR